MELQLHCTISVQGWLWLCILYNYGEFELSLASMKYHLYLPPPPPPPPPHCAPYSLASSGEHNPILVHIFPTLYKLCLIEKSLKITLIINFISKYFITV
jgi:hypothetical protein